MMGSVAYKDIFTARANKETVCSFFFSKFREGDEVSQGKSSRELSASTGEPKTKQVLSYDTSARLFGIFMSHRHPK